MSGPGRRPHALVLAGTATFDNVGDIAMCQVALRRLRRARPDLEVVLLAVPGAPDGHDVGEVQVLSPDGWSEWCRRVHTWQRRGRRSELVTRAPYRWPGATLAVLRAVGRGSGPAVREFLTAVRSAEVVVVCGQGGLHDGSARRAGRIADMLGLAGAAGVPAVMVGQGIGPLADGELVARLRLGMAGVGALGLRDERSESVDRDLDLSVPRIEVTGDDALDLVVGRPVSEPGRCLGVSVRVNDASGVASSIGARLGDVVGAALPDAPVQLVTMMEQPSRVSDSAVLDDVAARVGETEGPNDLLVPDAIAALARCRLVVTGTYHAAVFALGLGIPVVGLAGSDYYEQKLRGVLDLFGPQAGCVLDPHGSDFGPAVGEALRRWWARAPVVGDELRSRAADQVARGDRLFDEALSTLSS